jgi:protein-S-isoprenylcysteine O-methyltransferase Ste14
MTSPHFPKAYSDVVSRLRVPTGFLLVAAFAWFSAPTPGSLAAGLPLSLCGLAWRAWAAGHLAKNQQLATGGPYAFSRNPLYLGTLLVAAGLAVASRSAALGLLFAAVFVLVYLPVISLEEQHLSALFPGYRDYASRVPLLVPGRPSRGFTGAEGFRWTLYMKNQEYQALAGFLVGCALLAWKAFT